MSELYRRKQDEIQDDKFPRVAYVKEKLPSGNFGATVLNAGTFEDVIFNSLTGETSFLSLSSNTISLLEPGIYDFVIFIPLSTNGATSAVKAISRLRDITNNNTIETSNTVSQRASGADIHMDPMYIVETVTITSPTDYKVQTFIDVNSGGPIIGRDSTSGEDIVFGELTITKRGSN